jgi:hypothetical protein
METRALAIALFYAVGTAAGGIAGPVLFGQMIHTGDPDMVAIAFFIGAAAMTLGGIAELLFGVRAEQQSLENIARPLTALESEADAAAGERPPKAATPVPATAGGDERRARIAARADRRSAEARRGLRRIRPGIGRSFYSPAMAGTAGTASRHAASAEEALDREIEALAFVLAEQGELDRARLAELLDARRWGPGRFGGALGQAVDEGRVQRRGRRRYVSSV